MTPSPEIPEDTVAAIRKLRAKGFSVASIVKFLNVNEMLVASVCGVPLWRGKAPHEARDTQ